MSVIKAIANKTDRKRRNRIGKNGRALVLAVGVAGFLSIALIAPNALALFDDRSSRQREWRMKRTLEDLVSKGLLKKVNKGGKQGYELSDKGEHLAELYALGDEVIKKPLRWDGKWRVVMFDIKETMRGAREELRSTLVGLGFERIQRSVLVHPYPCAEVVVLIKKKYGLGKDVLYMEVDMLENDRWLRDAFFLR